MSELFDTIKTSVLGTRSSDIDKVIDNSFRSIEKYSISSDRNRYIEAIKDLVSKTGTTSPETVMKGLQGSPQVQNYDQSGRIYRYAEYEAITRKISYCQRALDTLTDHIISPDDITKTSIQFLTTDQISDDNESVKTTMARCKQIEKKLGIDKKIRKIVRSTLHKGDNFIEIIPSPTGQHALTILHEATNQLIEVKNGILNIGEPINNEFKYEILTEDNKKEEITTKTKVQLETTMFGGALMGMPAYFAGANISGEKAITQRPYNPPAISKDNHTAGNNTKEDEPEFKSKFDDPKNEEKKKKKLDLKDIFITIHNPKYIIRLETERFKTCLGYLVFPKVDPNTVIANSTMMTAGLNSVDALCADIIKQISVQLKNANDTISVTKDMKNTILSYLTSLQRNDDLKIRYVPPELMNHWRMNSELFYPYGESIFECVNFDCRLLVALKTAATIKQLTYATDKRVISVETGLPRDAKNIIESIKEGLNKKKISVDSMGSIDNIPSQIPTFETIYIPMRDGKKFVEFDKMEWGMNPQNDTEGLKFLRDNIVANLSVPAAYLGLEENIGSRSLLTVESIIFCRTIIAYQKELSTYLKELFEKIYKLVFEDYETLDAIQVTFQEPKISPYEHQMEYVEQIQRLIEALKTLGVPINWLKKKYLPDIDWDEIDKASAEEVIQKELGETPTDQELMGGIGGLGTIPGGTGGPM